jgi:predicted peptidase
MGVRKQRARATAIRCVVAIALGTVAARAEVTADDFTAGVFTDSRGTTLQYRLFEPAGYDPRGPTRYPLVTFLHGNGDQGSDNRRQVREGARVWTEPAVQERHPAFVLAPQCPADDGARPASAWSPASNVCRCGSSTASTTRSFRSR